MALPVRDLPRGQRGRPGAHGWGAAMSTDTAFALGVLALVGAGPATRLRVFLLTLAVVDDLVALLVIAIVYTDHVDRRRSPSRSGCSRCCSRCARAGVVAAAGRGRCSASACGSRCSSRASTRVIAGLAVGPA